MNDSLGVPSKRSKGNVSRRRFLTSTIKAGGLLLLPQIVPGSVLGLNGAVPPSERIVLGGIGLGHRGTYDLSCFMGEPDVQFVAVCDIKATRRSAIKQIADDKYENRDCAT